MQARCPGYPRRRSHQEFHYISLCRLCLLEESEENLRARYAIILKQREEAYKRVEEAKATAKYMDDKVAHYEAILAGLTPDDTNPKNWTAENRPTHKTENDQ